MLLFVPTTLSPPSLNQPAERNRLIWNAIPTMFPSVPNPLPRIESLRKPPAVLVSEISPQEREPRFHLFNMASYDSSSEENFAGMCAAAAVLAQQRQTTDRSTWVRQWLVRRLLHGAYSQLLEFFREDLRETKRFSQMSQENFRELLKMVGPRL
ncbi:hypothetical protein BaRGS_00018097 [Batillaria attramentaria]|uniref:Uncharacterized protein n=1 Tax=Batillaria attramentaria TaxID=370345 RepID=A0ABD0KU32_9CAEN